MRGSHHTSGTNSKFEEFNICWLVAEKAMHDRDYRAQLVRSAHDYDKTIEVSELHVEIREGMAAFL